MIDSVEIFELQERVEYLADKLREAQEERQTTAARMVANQAMILIMIENLEMRHPGLAADILDDLRIMANDSFETDAWREAYSRAAEVLEETVEFREPLQQTG